MTVPLPVLLVVAATLGAGALVAGLVVFAFARALTAAQRRLRLLDALQQTSEAELQSLIAEVDALRISYTRMVEKYRLVLDLNDPDPPPKTH